QAVREVVDEVRKASEAEPVIPPFMIPRILSYFHRMQQEQLEQQQEIQELREKLSAREIEILEHLVRGDDNKAIGEALVISPHTVRTHVQNIITKMNVHSKLEAAAFALTIGLVTLPRNDE